MPIRLILPIDSPEDFGLPLGDDVSEFDGEDDQLDDRNGYPGEDMDGDHDSAMASAGLGTDEDYSHDTPMGDAYGGE